MGWTFTDKPVDVKAALRRQLTWESETLIRRCMDIAMTLNVAYCAVEMIEKATEERRVIAVVVLMRYSRNRDYGWGYKDMDENWGPVEAQCPARILDLLTETDNENAREWRARCRENIERRPPSFGDTVRFEHPLKFTDGYEGDTFVVIRSGKRRKRFLGKNGGVYRIERRVWRDYGLKVVEKASGR